MKRTIALGLAAVLTGLIATIFPTITIQAKSISGLRFTSIQMFSSTNGWGEVNSNSMMKILHTTSGGVNWRDVAVFTGASGESFFGSGNKAWYVTTTHRKNSLYATVFRTIDGGQMWKASKPILLPDYSMAQIMFATSEDVGWLAVISTGGMFSDQTLQIWRTLDSGAHWKLMSNKNPTDYLLGFGNAQIGWAICVHAGAPLAAWLKNPVHSTNPFAKPVLYLTTNGGRTWNPQYLPVPDSLTQHNGYVSLGNPSWFGDNGYIPVSFTSPQLQFPYMKWGLYVSNNGGQTWHLNMENAVANNDGHEMKQVNFSIVSPNDFWESVTTIHQSNISPYHFISTYLYNKSSPTTRWTLVGVTPVPFGQIEFVTRNAGFALTQTGILYKSLNGGRDWKVVEDGEVV